MKSGAIFVILCLLLGYLAIATFMYFNQRAFLYFPSERFDHPYDRFSLDSDGESIEVVVLNPGNANALLYFGGNGEAVVLNADSFVDLYDDTTVYLFNYRGYGGSSGSPEEKGIYADAIALYDFVSDSHRDISVIGRSLGSGVATYVAAHRNVKQVVLVTPYDSILNLAKQHYPFLPVGLLLKDRFDSVSRAKQIQSRVLVVIAEHDEVIPRNSTEKLINGFDNDNLVVKVIQSAGHNTLSNSAEYHRAIRAFLNGSG